MRSRSLVGLVDFHRPLQLLQEELLRQGDGRAGACGEKLGYEVGMELGDFFY